MVRFGRSKSERLKLVCSLAKNAAILIANRACVLMEPKENFEQSLNGLQEVLCFAAEDPRKTSSANAVTDLVRSRS